MAVAHGAGRRRCAHRLRPPKPPAGMQAPRARVERHGTPPCHLGAWRRAPLHALPIAIALVVGCAGAAAAAAEAAAPAVEAPEDSASGAGGRQLLQAGRFSLPWRVCTSSWTPMVSCNPDEDPATYTGYVIELFRLLAHDLGWEEGTPTSGGWYLACLPYSEVMADLASPTGTCTMAAAGTAAILDVGLMHSLLPTHPAGVVVNTTLIDLGLVKFGWPIYKSGLRILIYGHLEAGSTWAFAAAFHWSLWMTCGGTAVLVGLLVAGVERCTLGQHANSKGVGGWLWASLAKMMFVPTHVGDPQTWASRVIMLGYAFLVMVMVYMYTAISASNLTEVKLVHSVHGMADIQTPHTAVVDTWHGYVDMLADRHNITAVGHPWEDDADTAATLRRLRGGVSAALVLDKSIVEYLAGTNQDCDLFVVGEAFETFSLALAFPSGFSAATISDLNRAIVRLQTQQGALDMLESTYIKTGGTDKCFSSSDGHASGGQIELRQVSGLWYILCFAIGACFLLTGAYNLRKNPVHANRLRSFRGSLPGGRSRIARVAVENSAAGASASGGRRPPLPRLLTESGGDDPHGLPTAAGGTSAKRPSGGTGGGAQRTPGMASSVAGPEAGAALQQQQQQQQQQLKEGARRPPELPQQGWHPTGDADGGDEVLELTPAPSHAGHRHEGSPESPRS